MISDHLPGSKLCSLGEGDLVVKPGRLYQPLLLILHMTRGPLYHKAHTVNQAHSGFNPVVQGNFCRLLWDKFGFRCHNGFSRSALGQFIPADGAQMFVLHGRKNQKLHEAFDKGGFPRPHRPHHSNIDFSPGSGFNISVYIKIVHKNTPLHVFIIYAQGVHLYYSLKYAFFT